MCAGEVLYEVLSERAARAAVENIKSIRYQEIPHSTFVHASCCPMGNACCPMGMDQAVLLEQAHGRRPDAAGIPFQTAGNQLPPPTSMVASGKLRDDEDSGMTEVEKLKQQRREAKAAQGAVQLPMSRHGPVLEEVEATPANVRRLSEAVDDLEWVANDDGTFTTVARKPRLTIIQDETIIEQVEAPMRGSNETSTEAASVLSQSV